MKILFFWFFAFVLAISACSTSTTTETETEVKPQTPVSVTTISSAPIQEFIELNATSSYMQKSVVKASSNGYIQAQRAQKGGYASAGQTLFTLITKEARAIGNSINKLDPSFKFTGLTTIRANASGYVSELSHQKGDYVQEGEQLAVISNANSFVFLVDVPYEQASIVKNQNSVELILPDGKHINGSVSSSLPSVDSASQTQRFAIHINSRLAIPEGLIAKVKVLKSAKASATSIVKTAVLTDEAEQEFWVMKLINDTTAIKVPVTKGIELQDRVEILSPAFSGTDRIISTGNYGLPDTAKVKIVHQ